MLYQHFKDVLPCILFWSQQYTMRGNRCHLISLYIIFSMNAFGSLFCAPKFHDSAFWCTFLFICPSMLYAVPNIPLDSGHTSSSGKFPSTSFSISFLYSLFFP